MSTTAARRPTLRRVTVSATVIFLLFATLSSVLLATLSIRVQRSLVDEAERLSNDEHIANLIVSSSYEQQIAAYRFLSSPSEAARRDFYAQGDVAYQRIRRYLFRPMPLEARRSIETIKEAHERFEVAVQRAFDLTLAADSSAERAQVDILSADAATVERAVRDFITQREQELASTRSTEERQLLLLQRLSVFLAVFLALIVAVMAIVIRRRVSVPISDLSDAVSAFGEGAPRVRVAPQRYQEFQDLADSFDRMADRIADSQAQVEARNRELFRTIQELERTQHELVQHEKMSAIGEMLAGLAHELNNPLGGILGIAEILKGDIQGSSDPAVRTLETSLVMPLIREAVRARDLVRNLLHFSRDERAELVPVSLADAINVAVGLRRHAYTQSRKEIVIEIPVGCAVLAQPQKLELVAINIVNNALDALNESSGTRLVISAVTEGEMLVLRFTDDGPGFVDPSRVFDPFYTTKPVGAGTGLGLALVHRFITEFGGTVTAENVDSGGASIVIRLRRSPTEAVPTRMPETVSAAAVPADFAKPPRALVVDDERALRLIQSRFLQKIGIEVDMEENGADACLALIRNEYDVVITDLRMPGEVGGLELLAWIRRERPMIFDRVIVVTGDLMADSVVGNVLPPPERIILKPFESAAYLQCVRQVLGTCTETGSQLKLTFPPGSLA